MEHGALQLQKCHVKLSQLKTPAFCPMGMTASRYLWRSDTCQSDWQTAIEVSFILANDFWRK